MRRVSSSAAQASPRRWAIWDERTLCVVIAVAAAACVAVACLQQAPCWTGSVRGLHTGCVDDTWWLFKLRGLSGHGFPYVHPGAYGLPRGTVEYPVLTGVFAWLVALPVHTATTYLFVETCVIG